MVKTRAGKEVVNASIGNTRSSHKSSESAPMEHVDEVVPLETSSPTPKLTVRKVEGKKPDSHEVKVSFFIFSVLFFF